MARLGLRRAEGRAQEGGVAASFFPTHSTVMPGLGPGIHDLIGIDEGVDGRAEPGHDEPDRR